MSDPREMVDIEYIQAVLRFRKNYECGTVLAAEQKLEFTVDDLDLIEVPCYDECGEVWMYEFDCPVCLDGFAEAVGLYEPRWLPFKDDDDKFGCRTCGAQFEKTVPGAYRMDTTWRLTCLDG